MPRPQPSNWSPDYTRPLQPREVVFIGGCLDGERRVLDELRPWVQGYVLKRVPIEPVAYKASELPKAVSNAELMTEDIYERQHFFCHDATKGGDGEVTPLYVVQGMTMHEAMGRLLSNYAPRREQDLVGIR